MGAAKYTILYRKVDVISVCLYNCLQAFHFFVKGISKLLKACLAIIYIP